jgi:hypothetical protein
MDAELQKKKFGAKSGKQDVILAATGACSKAERMMLLAGLGMIDPGQPVPEMDIDRRNSLG